MILTRLKKHARRELLLRCLSLRNTMVYQIIRVQINQTLDLPNSSIKVANMLRIQRIKTIVSYRDIPKSSRGLKSTDKVRHSVQFQF